MMRIRIPLALALILVTTGSSLVLAYLPCQSAEPSTEWGRDDQEAKQVVVRGRIVCLDSAGRRISCGRIDHVPVAEASNSENLTGTASHAAAHSKGAPAATSRTPSQSNTQPKDGAAGKSDAVGATGKSDSANADGSAGPTEKDQKTLFALDSREGKLWQFSSGDSMTAMFTDPRVRKHELQVTARVRPAGDLEIVKVQAIKNRKLYDLYYFCEICTITSYAPGPCPCCRAEMEFRESAAAADR